MCDWLPFNLAVSEEIADLTSVWVCILVDTWSTGVAGTYSEAIKKQ